MSNTFICLWKRVQCSYKYRGYVDVFSLQHVTMWKVIKVALFFFQFAWHRCYPVHSWFAIILETHIPEAYYLSLFPWRLHVSHQKLSSQSINCGVLLLLLFFFQTQHVGYDRQQIQLMNRLCWRCCIIVGMLCLWCLNGSPAFHSNTYNVLCLNDREKSFVTFYCGDSWLLLLCSFIHIFEWL